MAIGIEISVSEGTGKRAKPYSLNGDISGGSTLEELFDFNQRATFSIARSVLKEEQRKGFPKDPRVRTDNRFEKPDFEVNPLGKVEYFSQLDVGPALYNIMEELISRSPRDTGQYIGGHRVYYNNVEVARGLGSLKRFLVDVNSRGGFKPNDRIRFVNIEPYARKLEYKGVRRARGGIGNVTKGSRKYRRRGGQTLLRPNGAYYLTYRLVRRRYKSIANFMKFSFIPGGTKGVPNVGTFKDRRHRGFGRPYLLPSIIIVLSGKGITGLKGELSFE